MVHVDCLGAWRADEAPVQGTVYSIQLIQGSFQKCMRDAPPFHVGYGMQSRPLKAGLCYMVPMFLFSLGKGRQIGSHILGQVNLELSI